VATVVVLAVVVVFTVGVVAGVILLVSVASRREDRRRLSTEAPGRGSAAARLLTRLYIRRYGPEPLPGDERSHREPDATDPPSRPAR
jgi:hypothetical protein